LNHPEGVWHLSHLAFGSTAMAEPVRALAALLCKNKISRIPRDFLPQFIADCAPEWFQQFPAVKSEFLKKSLSAVIATAAIHCDFARLEILKHLTADLALFYPVLLQLCEDYARAFPANESNLLISAVLCDSSGSKAQKAQILAHFSAGQIFALYSPTALIPFFELQAGSGVSVEEDLCVAQFLLQLAQPAALAAWLPFYFKYAAQLSHALLEVLNEFVEGDEPVFFSEFLAHQPALFSSFLACLLGRCVLSDESELCRALEDLTVPDHKDPSAKEQFMHQNSDSEDSDEEGQINDIGEETDSLDSLRNCSLAILQVLTLCCPAGALSRLLLPLLFERFESPELLVRESAFSAFSVCTELVRSREFCGHLPNVLDFVWAQSVGRIELIRSASLQCLGTID
jgi:hypothetical protein